MCDGNTLLNEEFCKRDKPGLWTANEDYCVQTVISQVHQEVGAGRVKGREVKGSEWKGGRRDGREEFGKVVELNSSVFGVVGM